MTVLIGAHLGDGVGIAGDTRVGLGQDSFRDNALKVYQYPPFFIAGITGDALSAVMLLTEFYIREFMNISREEGLSSVVDADWMTTNIIKVYEDLEDIHSDRFGIIFASDDTISNLAQSASQEDLMDVVAVHSATFSDSCATLAEPTKFPGNRLLLSVSFPDKSTIVASPGQVISGGSGARFQSLLLSKTIVICAFQLSLGDRFAALSRDIDSLAELAKDTSFNGFSVGISLGRSKVNLTIHGYHHWPAGSKPEEYIWEPADPDEDGFPYTIPYSVGIDRGEIDTAWIYKGNIDDPGECRKLRLESYRDPEVLDRCRENLQFRFML